MSESRTVTPSAAAALLGVSIHTIRRWCEWHAAHLSSSARPALGIARRLTDRDIAILRAVQSLRGEGLTTPAVNERLAAVAVGEIVVGPQAAQEGQQGAALAAVAHDSHDAGALLHVRVQLLSDQVAEMKARQTSWFTAFAAGVIVSALFTLLIVVLMWLYSR